jgi:hypothetical protein
MRPKNGRKLQFVQDGEQGEGHEFAALMRRQRGMV